jgi:hypothetical protein
MRTEWHGRADFAEFADALGVRTDQIAAAQANEAMPLVVLYAPDDDEPTLLWSATLKRGVDRVLFVATPPEPRPGLWESIIEQVERDDDH